MLGVFTTLFFITKYWGDKIYCVHLVQNLGVENPCPSLKLCPFFQVNCSGPQRNGNVSKAVFKSETMAAAVAYSPSWL